ncbi:MAG: hypothetical protein FWF29_06285 [Treponema sp.]|nr:hypothetical protein [Treponema sp.]
MERQLICLSTRYLYYSFDTSGVVAGFIDRQTNENWAEPNALAFYLLPGGASKPVAPTRIENNGAILDVVFENVSFKLISQSFSDHLCFGIVDVFPKTSDFGKFVFGGCILRPDAAKGEYAGTVVSLSIKSYTLEIPGRSLALGAVIDSRLSWSGVSAVVIGAPVNLLSGVIRGAMAHLTIDDALVSPLGGSNAMEASGSRDDYIIMMQKLNWQGDWLLPVRAMNVIQVDFHQGMEYRHGDYVFLPEEYSGGVTDFKAKVVDRLHKEGMQAGLHTYSAMVDVNSSYVTPIPHPDLDALAFYTLANDIDPGAAVITLAENVGSVALIQEPHCTKYMTCMVIDDEIIQFSSKKEEHGLTGCERGALGTKASSHKKGASVKQLRCMYNFFQSRPGSALFYELALQMAVTYNKGEFDTVYFDGLECIGDCCVGQLDGLYWYYEALFVRETLRHMKKPPIIEYSTFHSALWAARSRAGAWDSCTSGYQTFIDLHCAKNENEVNRRLLPGQLGWWDLYPPVNDPNDVRPNWSVKIPFREDIEYLGVKSIAYDSALSYLSVSEDAVGRYPVYKAYTDLLEPYIKARRSSNIKLSVKEELQKSCSGYRLVDNDGCCSFQPTARLFARPYSLKMGWNDVSLQNPFHTQRPGIRLIAQSAADTALPGKPVILLNRSLSLTAQKTLYIFDPPLDLTGLEALGIWVKGNSEHQFLNIRLESVPPYAYGWGDHVIELDYTGWRFFNLCEQDNGDFSHLTYSEKINELDTCYSRYRTRMQYRGIGRIRFMYTGNISDVYAGDLYAYPVSNDPVVNPSVNINGKTIRFGTSLPPGSYLELLPGEAYAVQYDIFGRKLQVDATGEIGELLSGKNLLTISGSAEGYYRIKAHLLISGTVIDKD